MKRDWLFWLVAAIAGGTLVSGLIQIVAPGFVLGVVGASTSATSAHFFAIVGMFMALFGGMVLQALLSRAPQPLALFWGGLQKLGAALAVGLGVANAIFAPLAWLVAGFDLLSGLLYFLYWNRLR